MNNNEVRAAATEQVQNQIRERLSEKAVRNIHIMAAIFDGLAPMFNEVQREINEMALSETQAIEELIPGTWEMLPKNKRRLFLAEFSLAIAVMNRSQDKLGQLIQEQAKVLDTLPEEKLELMLQMQAEIFQVAKRFDVFSFNPLTTMKAS